MDNQHRQIKGYRELSAEEIALMNEIKTKGAELGELVQKYATRPIVLISAGSASVPPICRLG